MFQIICDELAALSIIVHFETVHETLLLIDTLVAVGLAVHLVSFERLLLHLLHILLAMS